MKKILFAVVIVGIVLGMNSCDEEDPNPFIGTWESDIHFHFVFTENVITVYNTNDDIHWTGTYTYNDTHITVKLDTTISDPIVVESWGDSTDLPYYFIGTVLYFNTIILNKI